MPITFEEHIATLESANATLAAECTRLMADRDETEKDLIRVAGALNDLVKDLRTKAMDSSEGAARAALATETADRIIVIVRNDDSA